MIQIILKIIIKKKIKKDIHNKKRLRRFDKPVFIFCTWNRQEYRFVCFAHRQFSSRWYLCARKSQCTSSPSLRSCSPKVVFGTVPIFVWLTMVLSHPFNENRQALPLSTVCSTSSSSTLDRDLPRRKPLMKVALPASLSARSFPFTPTCPV